MLHATFVLDLFNQDAPYDEVEGVAFARAHVEKTFSGDIVGTGKVEMLSSRTKEGAGYVALERLEVSLLGRTGSFALLHAGTMDMSAVADDNTSNAPDSKEENKPKMWATWPIVPGSGTGGLQTIQGSGTIEIDADGQHHLHLDCSFSGS